MIKDGIKSTIMKSLQQVINAYHGRGFKVRHILVDRQIECIRKHMETTGINLNTTAWDEHLPEIERQIQRIKERIRATTNMTLWAIQKLQEWMETTIKNETSSPMVSLEAMMLSCAIDANEGRHVAVTDIPGAFLHSDMDQDIHMLLKGTIAELIMKLEPRLYRKYIWKNKNNKPMLHLKLRKALTLTLKLGEQPNWWVDSSYAVHPDMCSHSRIVMTLRKGAAYLTSCKQKLNTNSSTEAELVAIDDAMGQILWTQNFLNGQGISTTTTTNIYQDNKSTMLLTENGKGWYIDVRYFFVTDKIKKGDVRVSFCPSHNMLGNFFTKPLQGAQFICMRSKILNTCPATQVSMCTGVCWRNQKFKFKISNFELGLDGTYERSSNSKM